ncbi:hypothetical protein HYN48_00940 [Flavobacterium magnum]|uniref:TonB C-terminal domain-containing protein n=1 Tax=Flavobacterium magnum TaxID=2162713 RepID=A0A2S0RB17_9FLAO|nr:hypothetical protein [Flavobacterium magnum]AWA28769.1 hypothetical protein HYN48_00940 [Flavobacterium magnum]
MMMGTKKLLYGLALLLLFSVQANAQKKQTLTDEEQVQEAVTKEIDELFTSKDFLKARAKKFADVKGTMVFDVGVVQNGKVSTFFKVDSDIRNIDFINWMSDYILKHKFFFKLQKQQRYKIRYTATFE